MEPKEIIRSNRRSLALTINENGELIVHAPKDMPLYEIMDFVNKKQSWIDKKSSSINFVLQKNRDIVSYNQLFFLGKRYNVVETKGIVNPYLTKDSLLIPGGLPFGKRKKVMHDWYVSNVETTIVPRVQKISNSMHLTYKTIQIINSKAKWGMCDSMKNLFFNWKLLMLSPELIDYVIVHELSHILEMNHSPKFWHIVGSVLPNYKHYQQIINRCLFLIKLY